VNQPATIRELQVVVVFYVWSVASVYNEYWQERLVVSS
jgi:hypothetical protein